MTSSSLQRQLSLEMCKMCQIFFYFFTPLDHNITTLLIFCRFLNHLFIFQTYLFPLFCLVFWKNERKNTITIWYAFWYSYSSLWGKNPLKRAFGVSFLGSADTRNWFGPSVFGFFGERNAYEFLLLKKVLLFYVYGYFSVKLAEIEFWFKE